MTKEYTVAERAALVRKQFRKPALTAKRKRELEEVLYTMSEAGDLAIDIDMAIDIWSMVQLVIDGRFSEEMRL